MILVFSGRGRDFLQVIFAQSPGPAPLHLLEVILAADIAHENQTLDGFHISASGDHINGNRDSGIVVVAEGTEDRLRIFCRISDLFAELVSLAKLLADDLNDIIRMTVRLGKDQCFGNLFAPREQGSIQIILEGANDCADLAWVDNVFIKLRRPVVYILVQLRPSLLTGQTIAVLYHLFEDSTALLANLRFDQENILANIDAINDGLFSGVFADDVLVKESEGALVRCGG